eukprot:SAG11_NODE_491_length_8977_cov_7.387249_2_plen_102_part_00
MLRLPNAVPCACDLVGCSLSGVCNMEPSKQPAHLCSQPRAVLGCSVPALSLSAVADESDTYVVWCGVVWYVVWVQPHARGFNDAEARQGTRRAGAGGQRGW